MKRRLIVSLVFLLAFSTNIFAQDAMKKWQTFNFGKQKITRSQIAKLDGEQLQILRGIVFGKRGRIFKEKIIQEYLGKQTWYKPKENFSNAVLTKTERENLDVIRLAEAASHDAVEPGDLRYWQIRKIPDEKLYTETAAQWRIMIAEVEAIHGKRFDSEPWLQKYFEERYWYKPNPNYSSDALTEIEHGNLEKLNSKRGEARKVAVSVGDMDKFQNVLLTEEILKGLLMNDLRLIRNEFWVRRGRVFKDQTLQKYFEAQSWYQPNLDFKDEMLSETESKNLAIIRETEQSAISKFAEEEG